MSQVLDEHPRSIAALALSGLAALLLLALVLSIISTPGTAGWLLAVPPAVLSLGVLAIGVQLLAGRHVDAKDAPRVAGWALAGTLIFLAIAGWLVVLEVLADTTIPHMATISTTAAALGAFVGAIVGLYDGTIRGQTRSLRAREDELAERNERLEQFASIVSHDLRNPLNVAMGYLDLAATADEPAPHFDAVEESLDRMETLIEDLLVLARDGEDVEDPSPVHLRSAAEEAWSHVSTAEATLECPADDRILAEKSRLTEVFENLFRNAVEHVGSDVTVRVEATEGGFAVEDDGPGIPPEMREDVLQLGETGNGGTGLGLYIVDLIADAHDWSLTITEGDRGGARFEFRQVKRPESDNGNGDRPSRAPTPAQGATEITP
ncbi:MAG: sensor histidine kinase [Halodesulfurarchaeum sp.]